MINQIEIGSNNCEEEALLNILEFPILLQLPSVYSIIAVPTLKGINDLNTIKNRLPGKNYGSLIGDLNKFFQLISINNIPKEYQNKKSLNSFINCFIRAHVNSKEFNSSVVRNGTHQALLLQNEKLRSLVKAIETKFANLNEKKLFTGQNYMAPLCTSANISGDPNGSIVSKEDAISFAKKRNIKLIISLNKKDISNDLGSYPIISLTKNKINIARKGPGINKVIELIPMNLRGHHFP